MLVLLIIFLITIPVVNQTIPVHLPKESNVARQTRAENIEVTVNRDGDVFWNMEPINDSEALARRLKEVAAMSPQPEVHIRGDAATRYESIGRVLFAAQQVSIAKVSFVIEPPPRQ
jgi:biopolymer transport protein ExbD